MERSSMGRSDERGFTLIEVLVALIILVLALTTFYRVFGMGILAAMGADRDRTTAEVAANLFEELGRSRPLQEGRTEGDAGDGQHWVFEIAPVKFTDENDRPPVMMAYRAVLVLTPGRGGSARRFETILLKPAQ